MPAWLSSDVGETAAVSSRSSRSPYDEDKPRRLKASPVPVPVPGLLLVETIPVGNAVLSERQSSPNMSITSTSSSSWTLLPDPGNDCDFHHDIACVLCLCPAPVL